MNKRISEMMDDLDPSLLKDNYMNEDEAKIRVVDELKEEDISLTNIKKLAMKNIECEIDKEMNQNTVKGSVSKLELDSRLNIKNKIVKNDAHEIIDLDTKRRKKRLSRKFVKRVIIPLVAAALLMGITVVAVGSSETLMQIFGEAFPMIQSESQDIGKSMTVDGMTFTAEGAVIDNKSGLFVVSFIKEDGTSFEEGTEVEDIRLEMEKRGGMGSSRETKLSEDGKKLVCVIDMSGDRKLYGQDITLRAKSPGKWLSGEEKTEANLYEAYKQSELNRVEQATRQNNKESEGSSDEWEYTGSRGIKIPLIQEIPQLTLDNIEWVDEELRITTSYPDPTGEEELMLSIDLVDRRTGQEVTSNGGRGSWKADEGISIRYERFLGIQEEDLAHLEMKIGYEYFVPITNSEWKIEFKLDKNNNIRTQKTNTRIKTNTQEVTIKEVELSTLGVKIEGIKHTRNSDYLEAYLQMKDGSIVNLWPTGMSTSFPNKIIEHFQVAQDDSMESNEPVEGDKPDVELSELSGTRRSGFGGSMVSIATRKTMSSEGMRIPKFLKIEEVASIVIEGKVIPIK